MKFDVVRMNLINLLFLEGEDNHELTFLVIAEVINGELRAANVPQVRVIPFNSPAYLELEDKSNIIYI